jgi:hypothetical protein
VPSCSLPFFSLCANFKVIGVFNIDPYGSNYPRELYDPKGYKEEDFVDRLKQAEASKTSHLAIPVNTAPAQPPIPQRPGVLGTATGPAGEARRPSKWGVSHPEVEGEGGGRGESAFGPCVVYMH